MDLPLVRNLLFCIKFSVVIMLIGQGEFLVTNVIHLNQVLIHHRIEEAYQCHLLYLKEIGIVQTLIAEI